MNTISLQKLPEWLNTISGKEIGELQEKAENLVDKIMKSRNSIFEIATDIDNAKNQHLPKMGGHKEENGTKFGQRVASLAKKIKKPDLVTYENLRGFLGSLDTFHRDLIQTGSVWIRRLDRSYKDPVRKIQL